MSLPEVKTAPLGFPTASAVVVASMIGVGVFSSLSFQVHSLSSGFSILFLWAVGALVALLGAFCYAELGAALPRSGGEYHLLSRIFHPSLGFLAGWVSLIAGFAAPIAAASMAFAAYLAKVSPALDSHRSAVALAIVALVSIIHATQVSLGARFQVAFTVLKLLLMLVLAAAAGLSSADTGMRFSPVAGDMALIASSAFAVSFVYVTYAYTGWNAAIYIAGETRSPQKTLPRALISATLLVGMIYLLVNYAFLKVVPISDMLSVNVFSEGEAGMVQNELAIGFLAGKRLFGEQGGMIIGALIALCLVSTISAMVLTGPRVLSTMAQDYSWLDRFNVSRANGVSLPPTYALALQFALVAILILSASFEAVMQYIGLTLSFFSCLVVIGLMRLRITEPKLARPFRCPGYPVTPMLFLAVNTWMLYFLASAKPITAIASAATIASGLVIYALVPKAKSAAA